MPGGAPPPPPGVYGGVPQPPQQMIQQPQQQQQQQTQQKHDIFVGNLAFTTTEEQLHQAFSEIGRVLKVRMVTDSETGKPRGFAFIEFEDPQAALSAIRNMNEYELNGRRIRVNFSNSSHLEALAGKLGMDLTQNQSRMGIPAPSSGSGGGGTGGSGGKAGGGSGGGTQAVADALKVMTKREMYDVIAKFKEMADRDPDEARRLLSGHPQLPEAVLHLMSKLDMIKTPVNTEGSYEAATVGTTAPPPPPQTTLAVPPPPAAIQQPPTTTTITPAVAAAVPADPRARPADPRARPADPRQAAAPQDPRTAADPRLAAAAAPPMMQQPPPPTMQQQQPPPPLHAGVPPPGVPPQQPPPQYQQPPPQQPPPANVANIDPMLVQQVMSLTNEQIAQLPPDKQQSILQLRQQITGGAM